VKNCFFYYIVYYGIVHMFGNQHIAGTVCAFRDLTFTVSICLSSALLMLVVCFFAVWDAHINEKTGMLRVSNIWLWGSRGIRLFLTKSKKYIRIHFEENDKRSIIQYKNFNRRSTCMNHKRILSSGCLFSQQKNDYIPPINPMNLTPCSDCCCNV
jgi:hypothetical protein